MVARAALENQDRRPIDGSEPEIGLGPAGVGETRAFIESSLVDYALT